LKSTLNSGFFFIMRWPGPESTADEFIFTFFRYRTLPKGYELSSSQPWPLNIFSPFFSIFTKKNYSFPGVLLFKLVFFNRKPTHPTVPVYCRDSSELCPVYSLQSTDCTRSCMERSPGLQMGIFLQRRSRDFFRCNILWHSSFICITVLYYCKGTG
jgi:hypothetical protein